MEKIIGVYIIINTVTKDFYIGSSKNVKLRWMQHKRHSVWKKYPNSQLYKDMKKFGVDKFELQLLEEVEPDSLKEIEQQFIEKLKPTYNNRNANGWNFEKKKKYDKEYRKTDKYKEYEKSDKRKKQIKENNKQYYNQLCYYNGQTLTLSALSQRFRKHGIPHPTTEAKKYLVL